MKPNKWMRQAMKQGRYGEDKNGRQNQTRADGTTT